MSDVLHHRIALGRTERVPAVTISHLWDDALPPLPPQKRAPLTA
jgi:hypothetical protein